MSMNVTLPLEPLRDKLYPYRPPYMALVDDVLSAEECAREMARMEKLGPDIATINAGGGRMVLNTNVRNNDRVIFDDHSLAADLFARLNSVRAIPETAAGVAGLGRHVDPKDHHARAVSLNERFRAYRYAPGQRFAPHHDGAFRRNEREVSEITVIVYLNEEFEGGETNFLDLELSVKPKRGMALLFAHPMLHEGCVVTSGRKYALRTDVMYRWPE